MKLNSRVCVVIACIARKYFATIVLAYTIVVGDRASVVCRSFCCGLTETQHSLTLQCMVCSYTDIFMYGYKNWCTTPPPPPTHTHRNSEKYISSVVAAAPMKCNIFTCVYYSN